jgi:hypothetical protein
MRWGRGFFRAWIFISAIWIAFSVMALFGPDTYRLSWLWHGPRITYSTPTGSVAEFDPSKSDAQLTEDVTATLKIEANKYSNTVERQAASDLLSQDRARILASIKATYEERKGDAWKAWQVTLIPPIALLAFGLCIAWIFRGFRPAT